MTNLADNLTRTAEQHGDRPAIKPDDLVLTYPWSMTTTTKDVAQGEVGAKISVTDLQAFAKERLAAYKYLRVVWIVDELPKGPTGKILRRKVSAPEGESK